MPDHFAEVNGVRAVEGRIVISSVGAPHAFLTLDKEASLPAKGLIVTLADLKMTCTPWRPVRPYQGRTSLSLIGGYGGWRQELGPQPYRSSVGVRLSLVLGEAARATGERIVVGNDRALGVHYARERAPASRLLNRHCPLEWWIDLDGTTRTGTRATSKITSPLSLISFDGARGLAVIATEFPGAFIPGRTFSSPQLSGELTISGVAHVLSKGKLRTEVLAA